MRVASRRLVMVLMGLATVAVTLARALQVYGAYVVDVGEDVALRGEANIDRGYDAWAKVGMTVPHEHLSNLPWTRFRVLQLQPC